VRTLDAGDANCLLAVFFEIFRQRLDEFVGYSISRTFDAAAGLLPAFLKRGPVVS
jgi:hypothetical protein